MKRILMAGSGGIIGREIGKYFINKYSVYNINKSELKGSFQLDLLNKEEIDNFVKNSSQFDILIFLVGLAHSKGKKADYSKFHDINYITLVNLLDSMNNLKKLPKQIIYTSSISVYGERMHKEIYDEESNLKPVSPYAKTKLNAEKYLLNNYKKRAWVLRLSPVYSKLFLLNIHRRIKLFNINYIISNGKSKLSLCNIKNIEFVIEKIINNKIKPDYYNLSDSKYYTYNDLLNKVNPKFVFKIPALFIKIIYFYGKLINNPFFIENSIKLISNNIYPPYKIENQINLPYSIKDN